MAGHLAGFPAPQLKSREVRKVECVGGRKHRFDDERVGNEFCRASRHEFNRQSHSGTPQCSFAFQFLLAWGLPETPVSSKNRCGLPRRRPAAWVDSSRWPAARNSPFESVQGDAEINRSSPGLGAHA